MPLSVTGGATHTAGSAALPAEPLCGAPTAVTASLGGLDADAADGVVGFVDARGCAALCAADRLHAWRAATAVRRRLTGRSLGGWRDGDGVAASVRLRALATLERLEALAREPTWGCLRSAAGGGDQWRGARLGGVGLLAVTELQLGRRALAGPLPRALFELRSLRRLYLHCNSLTGALPSCIGQLRALLEVRRVLV